MKISRWAGACGAAIRIFRSRQFVIFLLTGGVSATVNFFSRILYNVAVPFSVAVALAYVTGMAVAFILAKRYVFGNSPYSLRKSVILFAVVNGVGLLESWLVSMVFEYHILPIIGVYEFTRSIATLIGIAVPAFTSFIGYKYWVFRVVDE